MRRAVWILLAFGLAHARAGDLPYPVGLSDQVIEGLQTALHVPYEMEEEGKASLLVLLHGLGDNGKNLIRGMTDWVEQNYLVCAPSSRGRAWSAPDVKAVVKIAVHLKKVMPVDPKKIHVLGFSNGGWSLAPLAFDDEVRPCSATWIAAGFGGGKVPSWARKGLGAIALAGEKDNNARAARATVTQLREKVRSVEVRLEAGLGHAWPRTHNSYLLWWMGIQEGRFVPGEDLNFEWNEDVREAVAALENEKRGGVIVYVFSSKDADASVQSGVLMDPAVRWYGSQLQAVKLEMGDAAAALGVKSTPALVVLDRTGKVKKLFDGKIKAKAVASALRSVAPNKSKPD
jgi:predicted esterase